MKLFLSPTPNIDPSQKAISGVERVVIEQRRHLIDYLEFVDSPLNADVLAAHVMSYVDTIPSVLHNHGLYPTGEYPDLPRWMWRSNRRIIDAIRKAKRITVPSLWVSEMFIRDMGFAPIIVPHGINLNEWEEVPSSKEMSVVWNKNRVDEICSFAPVQQLAASCPDIKFISTFGTPAKNLQIIGLQSYEKMKEILYQNGIYFAPTKETFGIGLIEALASGMTVLAWNWGNATELIKHKITGYLAKPGDYDDTVAGLRFCIENFDRLSQAARKESLKHDWKTIMPRYVEVYESVLEEHKGPKITVVIPCYNYGAFIADAIRSVKAQTFENWECIVIDDGSTDDSLIKINEAVDHDPKFKVLAQSNRGVAKARNRGAMEAKGEFLCFLDADDTLKERFMETLISPLLDDRSIGISFGSLELHTPRGSIRGSWPSGFDFDVQLRRRNQVPSCNLLRRDAFFRAGGYKTHFTLGEDAELWTNIGLCGFTAIHASQAPTMIYRIHKDSITNKTKEKEPNWLNYISAANGGPQPFASIATPQNYSHPVYSYDQPLVSIVIPVGDGHEEVLVNAIESVRAQTDARWELIVVDDTTLGKVRNCGIIPYVEQYPFINWRRKRKYGNVSAARNLGVQHARGKFLLFLDADDELDKHFLRQTLKVASVRPKSIIYTDWISLPEDKIHKAEVWNFERLKQQALFVITFLHPREAFDEVDGFNEDIPVWEDWDYTVQLAHKGYHGIRVPEPLFLYHFETGKRREECLDNAQELMKEFRERYATLEALPPKESGLLISLGDPLLGRKKTEKKDTPMPTKVLVRYSGDNLGARTFKTPLGSRYRFDGRNRRESWIPIRDAHFFERMLDFRVVEVQ